MRLIISAIFVTLTILTSTAQADPVTKPHFYIVTKGNKTHYILGTFHYAVRFADFPPVVHESLKKSKSFISEISVADFYKKEIWTKLEDLEAKPLPKLKAGHVEKLQRLGVHNKLMPTNGNEAADAFVFYPFQGNLPYYIMDFDIYFQAKDAGKKMLTLDTPALITKSMDHGNNHTTGLTVEKLLDTMSEEDIRNWGKTSIDGYLAGPEKAKEPTDGAISYRNNQWMPKILKYYKKNDLTFMAVGEAHLYGRMGLLNLLKAHGYSMYSTR